MKKYAIILAAGKGTRMKTELPKCAYPFCGKPMVEHIVDNCLQSDIDDIWVVVGYKKEKVMDVLGNKVHYVVQDEQLGTGHAIMCCQQQLSQKEGLCIIIPGDMPLVDVQIINQLVDKHIKNNNSLTVVSTIVEDAMTYGRIYREDGKIKKIIEYKEATEEQRKIKEVNSSMYCVDMKMLFSSINLINHNNEGHEYYLTDIVEIISKNQKVDTLIVEDSVKLTGINDLDTLRKTELVFMQKY